MRGIRSFALLSRQVSFFPLLSNSLSHLDSSVYSLSGLVPGLVLKDEQQKKQRIQGPSLGFTIDNGINKLLSKVGWGAL